MSELLTAEQVAEIWGVSPSLLRSPSWRRRHGLPAVRIGRLLRFEPQVIATFCERQREGRRVSDAEEDREPVPA